MHCQGGDQTNTTEGRSNQQLPLVQKFQDSLPQHTHTGSPPQPTSLPATNDLHSSSNLPASGLHNVPISSKDDSILTQETSDQEAASHLKSFTRFW